MSAKRSVFFISDRTGITAEMLGHSLLTQFEGMAFNQVTIPFVDTVEKAHEAADQINNTAITDAMRPIVVSTLVDAQICAVISQCNALVLDLFQTFIAPLETELKAISSHTVGRSHSMLDNKEYSLRIEAVNYALAHDDGMTGRGLRDADIILVGVSRSGKTPTCLYMALQFGIRAANYPLVPEDFSTMQLPQTIQPFHAKLYGLSINPERLEQIRRERSPKSRYASLSNCKYEVHEAEALMRQEGIRFLDATTKSIEEIATTILHEARLVRHIY